MGSEMCIRDRFTSREWGTFGITNLRANHYVRSPSGDTYYQPARSLPVSGFGLRWESLHERPTGGVELINDDLAKELLDPNRRLTIQADELKKFGVKRLQYESFLRYERWFKPIVVSGLEWQKMDIAETARCCRSQPAKGKLLDNPQLSDALQRKGALSATVQFTRSEWYTSGIVYRTLLEDVRADHVVKAGAEYFKPVPIAPIGLHWVELSERPTHGVELTNEGLAEALLNPHRESVTPEELESFEITGLGHDTFLRCEVWFKPIAVTLGNEFSLPEMDMASTGVGPHMLDLEAHEERTASGGGGTQTLSSGIDIRKDAYQRNVRGSGHRYL